MALGQQGHYVKAAATAARLEVGQWTRHDIVQDGRSLGTP